MSYFIYKFLHLGDTLKELEGSPPLKKLKQLDLKQMKQGKVDNKIPQTVHRTLTILKAQIHTMEILSFRATSI